MKNIHILRTDQPSRLFLEDNNLKLDIESYGVNGRNMYITSDEDVKYLDYYITKIKDSNGEREIVGQRLDTNDSDYSNCKKVILTTDPQLIADGVQEISEEFLEWFVKNSSCEFVEVNDICDNVYVSDFLITSTHIKYEIIIPKQERKIDTCHNFNIEIGCTQTECTCEKEEPKTGSMTECINSLIDDQLDTIKELESKINHKINMKFFKIYIKLVITFLLWVVMMNYAFDTYINREVNVFLQIGVLGAMGFSSYLLAYYIHKQIQKHTK